MTILEWCDRLQDLLSEAGMEDVPVYVGGHLLTEDALQLNEDSDGLYVEVNLL